jgi:hypothetical protein
MTAELVTTADAATLTLIEAQPMDQNPAAVYLAGLGSQAGRRAMQQALNTVAGMASGGLSDCLTVTQIRLSRRRAVTQDEGEWSRSNRSICLSGI